ncbi:zinc finger FYVE domain-containing protein 21-like isoform X1 [Lytechinus variegatus]|uniref:zinc finger FYVE domain-containing protein 21-like isoform X1 n=1 Tax=Lytechinus variegatus TaxID=7654 RepID=UPI001BB183A7|nr:zinc finger FYVE domain-containing protein 21-like isoform X1 [Lytechinus variegatus]
MMATSGKQLVRSKSGLRMVSVEEKDTSPFQLQEPPWIPDEQCHYCMKCQAKYDLVKRRHHCRRCGKCFCGPCCSTKVLLPRMNFVDPVRLCEECATFTRKENEFFNKHLKALMNGCYFSVETPEEGQTSSYCKLTSNHRNILFNDEKPDKENTKTTMWVHDPVALLSIQNLQIMTSETNVNGHMIPKAVTILYKYIDETREVTMTVPDDSSRKQSIAWIVALQKAYKLLNEAKRREELPSP